MEGSQETGALGTSGSVKDYLHMNPVLDVLFLLTYLGVASVGIYQLVRLLRAYCSFRKEKQEALLISQQDGGLQRVLTKAATADSFRIPLIQHVFVTIICVTRASLIFPWSDKTKYLLIVLILITNSSIFWLFTLVLVSWATIVHRAALERSELYMSSADKIKILYISANLLITTALVLDYVFDLGQVDRQHENKTVWHYILDWLYPSGLFLFGVMVTIYGTHITRLMKKLKLDYSPVTIRFFRATIVLSACFLVHTTIWLANALAPQDFIRADKQVLWINSFFFLQDTGKLITALLLYAPKVASLSRRYLYRSSSGGGAKLGRVNSNLVDEEVDGYGTGATGDYATLVDGDDYGAVGPRLAIGADAEAHPFHQEQGAELVHSSSEHSIRTMSAHSSEAGPADSRAASEAGADRPALFV